MGGSRVVVAIRQPEGRERQGWLGGGWVRGTGIREASEEGVVSYVSRRHVRGAKRRAEGFSLE